MAQRCKKCGASLTDTDRFCPNCGENISPAVRTEPAFSPPPYPPRQNGAGMPPPPVYPAPAARPAEEMTLGKWVLTLFVTNCLGFVSWIFLFIWGFGQGPVSRSNYCKAMLIVKAVGTVAAIVFFVLYAGVILPAFLHYLDYGEYGEFSYMAAAVFPAFFG